MRKGKIVYAAAVMAASFVLTACSGFKVTSELSSGASVEKNIDGMEKLDEKRTESFIKEVNRKYSRIQLQDIGLNIDGSGDIAVNLGDIFEDTDIDIAASMSGDISMNSAGDAKYTDAVVAISLPVFGRITIQSDGYNDAAENCSYTLLKDVKSEGGLFPLSDTGNNSSIPQWTKKKNETPAPDGKAFSDIKLTLDPGYVNGIYENKNTGSYIVDMKPEALNSVQKKANASGMENAKLYVTYGQGIALSGIYFTADKLTYRTDDGEDELVMKNAVITADVTSLNTGADLKVPEDIRDKAVEEHNDNEDDALGSFMDLLH